MIEEWSNLQRTRAKSQSESDKTDSGVAPTSPKSPLPLSLPSTSSPLLRSSSFGKAGLGGTRGVATTTTTRSDVGVGKDVQSKFLSAGYVPFSIFLLPSSLSLSPSLPPSLPPSLSLYLLTLYPPSPSFPPPPTLHTPNSLFPPPPSRFEELTITDLRLLHESKLTYIGRDLLHKLMPLSGLTQVLNVPAIAAELV